jgi:hypothetical protein
MNKFLSFTVAMLLSYSSLSVAESIAVPVGLQGVANQNIERPARGGSKAQVSNQFGSPNQQTASVGTPPISQWTYDSFTVYFENDYVIHSVLHP